MAQASDETELPPMGDEGPSTIDRNAAFDALSSPRRRYAFHYLKQQGSPVVLSELARAVAAWDHDDHAPDVEVEQARVRRELHARHLPALENASLVTYDRSDGTVAVTPLAEQVDTRVVISVQPVNAGTNPG